MRWPIQLARRSDVRHCISKPAMSVTVPLGRRDLGDEPYRAIAYERAVVVVPAHNEVANLPRCLNALVTAAACFPAPTLTVVVLDDCDDESTRLAGRFGSDVHFIEVEARNVGAARAAGFVYSRTVCAVAASAQHRVWYATTDADSRVDADWLVRQTDSGADMVLGVVRVENWQQTPAGVVRRYLSRYRAKRKPDGHGHVHGANMGFRADKYWKEGGFAAIGSGEDVDLAQRFEQRSYRIHRDDGLSVETSARRVGRAPEGFAAYLRSFSRREGVG
ncbi:Glycosyl transferase family 2 [Mycobacteroides salmoniphilum]|uniref:4,4'-diaponeurosporenoate glycosyltransferase n=2 Tax=Mycobacteroides salmoniphilum TaxID=404941 RepID=A0A4V3I1B4_9MYCO|nr:Glycosyl transferase family 2 [Mycobacteroides salmoniphilum]